MVDSCAQPLLLVRSKQPSIVGIKPPSQTRIELCPAFCNLAVRHHLFHQFECQFGLVRNLEYAVEGSVDANFGANGLATLIGFVADGEFEE